MEQIEAALTKAYDMFRDMIFNHSGFSPEKLVMIAMELYSDLKSLESDCKFIALFKEIIGLFTNPLNIAKLIGRIAWHGVQIVKDIWSIADSLKVGNDYNLGYAFGNMIKIVLGL